MSRALNSLERELLLALQALIAASAAIKQRSAWGSPGWLGSVVGAGRGWRKRTPATFSFCLTIASICYHPHSNHPFTITDEAQTVWSDPPHWLADPGGVDGRVAGHNFDRVGARRSRSRSARRTSYARTTCTVSRQAWVGSSAILLWVSGRHQRSAPFPLVRTRQSLR